VCSVCLHPIAVTPTTPSKRTGHNGYQDPRPFQLIVTPRSTLHFITILHHIIYLLSRLSFDAWETLEELLVLSHSSQPDPEALKNTFGGILSKSTFQRRVRVRIAKKDKRAAGGEELKLLFDSVPEEGYEKVKMGRAYGAAY
jgi:hypothetical protein